MSVITAYFVAFFLTELSLRLKGPASSNGAGRVEILHNGEWGTICDDFWDINNARVVCRQLGYQNALEALQGNSASAGSGQIWLDDVRCIGSEKNLASCSHQGWGVHNCNHYEDAGVKCTAKGKFKYLTPTFSHPNLCNQPFLSL